MSCSCALRSGNAPMKPRNRPTRFSAPSTVPRVPPCHLTSGVTYSDARSGSCALKTRRVYSRTISTFDSARVLLTIVPLLTGELRLPQVQRPRPDCCRDENRSGGRKSERLGRAVRSRRCVPVLRREVVFDTQEIGGGKVER